MLSSRNVWLGEGGVRKRPPATEQGLKSVEKQGDKEDLNDI